MGIASIILGSLAILLSWIPCLWPIVAVHVLLGLGLGIGDIVVKKNAPMGKSLGDEQIRQGRFNIGVAGICINVTAVILTIVWQLFWQTKGFGIIN